MIFDELTIDDHELELTNFKYPNFAVSVDVGDIYFCNRCKKYFTDFYYNEYNNILYFIENNDWFDGGIWTISYITCNEFIIKSLLE